MDELRKNLTSGSWWIGVVIVGVIINLISAYLKSPTDTLFNRFSVWRSSRTEKLRTERKNRISLLKSNPHEQLMAQFREMRMFLTALVLLCTAIFIMGFLPGLGMDLRWSVGGQDNLSLQSILAVIGSVLTMISTNYFVEGISVHSEVREARLETGMEHQDGRRDSNDVKK